MAYGLTFVIHPDGETISVNLFLRTIEDVDRLIRDVDYAVSKERGTRRWIIAALHSSAPTITLKPVLDNDEIVEAFVNGLRTITTGALEPPAHFTEQALDDLKRMRRLFVGQDRAKRLVFSSNGKESAAIEKGIDEKAERILRGGYWNLGSVEGTLEALNLHGNPTFTVWDRVSRAPVRCSFPRNVTWKERVKELLERRVLVVGRVNYFRNGIPRSVTNIERIDDMTPAPNLPKATFGSIPSPIIAENPVGYLRAVRGEGSK
ncbi:MAG: hypothetical protein HY665_03510 [Chloroflexi bacterium]|nr:hypothetical protein [Chloroflexota bacterium]